jgi:hypothetical protein
MGGREAVKRSDAMERLSVLAAVSREVAERNVPCGASDEHQEHDGGGRDTASELDQLLGLDQPGALQRKRRR